MKYLSILFFISVTTMCNGQLTEYRMLFPFPYIGDSVAIKHIHEIKIKTYYSTESLSKMSNPDLLTFFQFDESGRLMKKLIAKCDTCPPRTVLIANPDSGNIAYHKALFNSKAQLTREETINTIDVYAYDKSGRIFYHALVIPLGKADTSYDATYHYYNDKGKPDYSVRYSFTLHTNAASGLRDTVGTRKSYARYLYKSGRLNCVLADLPFKSSTEARFTITYKYISRFNWEVYFFDAEKNKNTCVWKVEEKQ